jgi:hypothetical protein
VTKAADADGRDVHTGDTVEIVDGTIEGYDGLFHVREVLGDGRVRIAPLASVWWEFDAARLRRYDGETV